MMLRITVPLNHPQLMRSFPLTIRCEYMPHRSPQHPKKLPSALISTTLQLFSHKPQSFSFISSFLPAMPNPLKAVSPLDFSQASIAAPRAHMTLCSFGTITSHPSMSSKAFLIPLFDATPPWKQIFDCIFLPLARFERKDDASA